jgi:hypothetical protein
MDVLTLALAVFVAIAVALCLMGPGQQGPSKLEAP